MTKKGHVQLPIWLIPAGASRATFKATEPLSLPRKAPPCFLNKTQWGQYRVLAQMSGTDGFNYCSDCTPEYRDEMVAEKRCKYPKTKFVKVRGVIRGQRSR